MTKMVTLFVTKMSGGVEMKPNNKPKPIELEPGYDDFEYEMDTRDD